MLLYLFIWEHFISRIIEYSFHKVTHQTAIVMVVLLVIMLAIGVSISVAVGLSSALAMLCMLDANISFATSAQRLFAGANSFSLIAIPFFILAGNIMNNGGIAERIVNVAKVVAGRMPGALAQSNVVANMLFGAISGSGAAAAAAMGGTIGPMEKKEGYCFCTDGNADSTVQSDDCLFDNCRKCISCCLVYGRICAGNSVGITRDVPCRG